MALWYYKCLSAITTSNTADLYHRSCTKIDYYVLCLVVNFRALRLSLRSAAGSISENIRPWIWEMASQVLEPRSTSIYGPQICTRFAVIVKVSQASSPIAARPIPGNPRTVVPVSQPPVSPDFPAGTRLGYRTLRIFLYIPGAQRVLF
jgi:hypothetical protein